MKTIKNAKFESTRCIICEADDAELIYKGRGEYGFEVHVCICKHCGFVYLNPRWDENTYFRFYQATYDKYWRKYPSNIPPERDSSSYYLLYQRLIKHFPDFKPSYVLDIGSGNGRKLAYIMQQQPDAKYFAIEPSIAYKSEIESRGIQFISNDVNSDWDANLDKFDFIIMRHTLEHFLDPIKVLTKARSVLSDNGLLYIAVPDAQSQDNRLVDSNFTVVHPYFFSENSLTMLLQKSGFEVAKVIKGNKFTNIEQSMFAKKGSGSTLGKNNANDYHKTLSVFYSILNKELSLKMRVKRSIKANLIVSLKKRFFPKPIFQKQPAALLKEE